MNSDYSIAVHALVYLDHMGTSVTSSALAENICANAATVRKVMGCLTAAGLAAAKEGPAGGYRLSRPAADISLGSVADAVKERFVCGTWKSGDVDKACAISSGMADVMDGLYDELDAVCRDRLKDMTIADMAKRIEARSAAKKAAAE